MPTEAGKRLLRFLRKQRENDTDNRAWRNGIQYAEECVAMDLPRIEAEAVAAERARIRAAVGGLDGSEFIDDYGDADRPGTTYFAIDRAAVLAIIEGA